MDSYANTNEFKALSKDKQEAILSLKAIEPSPMPQEITQENLENLFKHFNSKQDKAQREFYAKLFNDTKENPHIVLQVQRDNETRQEDIKAYQHKATHDLYYIAITQENDTIKVTGYPITKIKDVINQIKNAEKVVWRQKGDQTHTALSLKETLSLENAKDIIPQQSKDKIFNQGEGESYKTITQQEALDLLETLPTTTLPKELDIDTFLKSLENIENKENFIEHLQSKTDAQSRLAYLNIVEPTLRQPQMILEFANKKEYIKSFKDENGKNILNLIITKQDDTMLITMIPNVKASYLKSEINKADIIRSFIPQGSNKERTTTADYTTNKIFNQDDIKFDSLGDFERFARLSGFENLPQEKLQSAHKYILENLHKLEC